MDFVSLAQLGDHRTLRVLGTRLLHECFVIIGVERLFANSIAHAVWFDTASRTEFFRNTWVANYCCCEIPSFE